MIVLASYMLWTTRRVAITCDNGKLGNGLHLTKLNTNHIPLNEKISTIVRVNPNTQCVPSNMLDGDNVVPGATIWAYNEKYKHSTHHSDQVDSVRYDAINHRTDSPTNKTYILDNNEHSLRLDNFIILPENASTPKQNNVTYRLENKADTSKLNKSPIETEFMLDGLKDLNLDISESIPASQMSKKELITREEINIDSWDQGLEASFISTANPIGKKNPGKVGVNHSKIIGETEMKHGCNIAEKVAMKLIERNKDTEESKENKAPMLLNPVHKDMINYCMPCPSDDWPNTPPTKSKPIQLTPMSPSSPSNQFSPLYPINTFSAFSMGPISSLGPVNPIGHINPIPLSSMGAAPLGPFSAPNQAISANCMNSMNLMNAMNPLNNHLYYGNTERKITNSNNNLILKSAWNNCNELNKN